MANHTKDKGDKMKFKTASIIVIIISLFGLFTLYANTSGPFHTRTNRIGSIGYGVVRYTPGINSNGK